MEIKIKPQSPDGVNVSITDLVFDTYEQTFEIIKLVKAIQEGQKIKTKEIVDMLKR